MSPQRTGGPANTSNTTCLTDRAPPARKARHRPYPDAKLTHACHPTAAIGAQHFTDTLHGSTHGTATDRPSPAPTPGYSFRGKQR